MPKVEMMLFRGRRIALLLGLLATLYWLLGRVEREYLFGPVVDQNLSPSLEGVQELSFLNEDGVHLNAWWLPAPRGAPTILYFHGQHCNLRITIPYFRALKGAGLGVMAIDFRGFGKRRPRGAQ